MTVFEKLQYKGQPDVHVLSAPDTFLAVAGSLPGVSLHTDVSAGPSIQFSIAFAESKAALDFISARVLERVGEEAILWFAYPKGTSKRYRCDFNRDTGWEVLGVAGYECVRMVSIDEDWSAMRFRRTGKIRSFMRSETMALSEEGKKRAKKP